VLRCARARAKKKRDKLEHTTPTFRSFKFPRKDTERGWSGAAQLPQGNRSLEHESGAQLPAGMGTKGAQRRKRGDGNIMGERLAEGGSKTLGKKKGMQNRKTANVRAEKAVLLGGIWRKKRGKTPRGATRAPFASLPAVFCSKSLLKKRVITKIAGHELVEKMGKIGGNSRGKLLPPCMT